MVEAKRRDHRVLGKKLDLFSLQEDAGGGLVSSFPSTSASTENSSTHLRKYRKLRRTRRACRQHADLLVRGHVGHGGSIIWLNYRPGAGKHPGACTEGGPFF